MSWDIGFTAGLADEGVQSSLAQISQSIKENTHDLRGFATAMSGVNKLVTGLAGGFGAVAVYQTLAGLADQMFMAARREAQEREKSRQAAEATYNAGLRSFQLDVGGDSGMKSVQAIRDRVASLTQQAYDATSAGGRNVPYEADWFGKNEDLAAKRQRLNEQFQQQAREVAYWGERAIENLEREDRQRRSLAATTREQFTQELEMQKLAASGLTLEAQTAQEAEKHSNNLAKISANRQADHWEAEKQLALEEQRHTATLQNVQDEKRARDDAESKRMAAEFERAQSQQMAADTLEATLDIERLKLAGLKDQADEAERRLKHEQAIFRIMQLQGISEEQRARLMRAEDNNFANRAGETPSLAKAGASRTVSAGTGFVNFGDLSRLALAGGRDSVVKPMVVEQKKTNAKMDQLINSVRNMAGGAVYA